MFRNRFRSFPYRCSIIAVITNGAFTAPLYLGCMSSTRVTGAKLRPYSIISMLARLVDTIDRRLRSRLKIIEFSNSPDCLFRLQIIESDEAFALEDGTFLQAGDRLVDLHFWNEHVPVVPSGGPTLAFARRIERCLDLSLAELARYLTAHADLADVKAIRGNMSLGARGRSEQIARVASKYGFKRFPRRRSSLGDATHQFGENILITLLVMRSNPRAVRMDTLWRDRTLTFLSRAMLERRYGG